MLRPGPSGWRHCRLAEKHRQHAGHGIRRAQPRLVSPSSQLQSVRAQPCTHGPWTVSSGAMRGEDGWRCSYIGIQSSQQRFRHDTNRIGAAVQLVQKALVPSVGTVVQDAVNECYDTLVALTLMRQSQSQLSLENVRIWMVEKRPIPWLLIDMPFCSSSSSSRPRWQFIG